MHFLAFTRRLDRLQIQIDPPTPETRLPYLVMDFDTGGDMPGFEAHNQEHRQIARRLRCSPNVYNFDPDRWLDADGSDEL